MSRPRMAKNWDEATDIVEKFYGHKHMLIKAMVQFAEREKIRATNSYRKKLGEPVIDLAKEPPKEPNGENLVWVIDVPREWYSLTGKDKS